MPQPPLIAESLLDNPDLWSTLAFAYLDQGVTVSDQKLRLVAWNQCVNSLQFAPDLIWDFYSAFQRK